MKYLKLFDDWKYQSNLEKEARILAESDAAFDEWLSDLSEGRSFSQHPEEKDIMRMTDIVRKAKEKGKDADDIKKKELSLANTQAKLIQDVDKCIRRGRAAMQMRGVTDDQKKDIATPFFQKAIYLGGSDDLTDAERHMVRGVALAAELGIGD